MKVRFFIFFLLFFIPIPFGYCTIIKSSLSWQLGGNPTEVLISNKGDVVLLFKNRIINDKNSYVYLLFDSDVFVKIINNAKKRKVTEPSGSPIPYFYILNICLTQNDIKEYSKRYSLKNAINEKMWFVSQLKKENRWIRSRYKTHGFLFFDYWNKKQLYTVIVTISDY